MMKLLYCAALIALVLSSGAAAQNKTFLQTIAGNWEGTLEYQDYSANKRVKLKTYLTVTPAADGTSAEFSTVYDDVSRIIKDWETVKIDLQARKYIAGKSEYAIDSSDAGKIVLLGSGQDGENVEPIRQTITFDENSLVILKETRAPWQFRNQIVLKRTAENVLAKRILTPTHLKEDFDVFKKTLTAIHPGIYRYQTPASLEKLFAELESKLRNPLPEAEFFKLIAQLTSRIACGHTFINPYNLDAIVRERIFGGKNHLPFYFQIVGGKMIVSENAAPQNLSKGSEITKINGVPVRQIIEALLTVTKADGRNTPAHRIESLELNRFEAERYALFDMYFPLFFPPANETYAIEAIDFASKKPVKFQTSAMSKEQRTAEMTKRYGAAPTYDDGWKFEIQDASTAYLKIDNSITWRLKKIKFKEFLADVFAQMRPKNVKNLVVDLRGNGGGDMNVGFELSKYLAQKTLPVYAENKRLVRNVSAQPDLAEHLSTYSAELKSVLQNGASQITYKKAENNFFEILPNPNTENFPNVTPYENNFRGNAYVIADSSAASATFQFLNYAQENRLAKIVGQPTGGNKQGINGGNYFFLYLPHSRVEIDVPVYFQAPLAPQKDSGVIPDVYVKQEPENIGRSLDAELLKVKALIKRN